MTFTAAKITDEIKGLTHIHVCVNGGATFGVLEKVWSESSPDHDPDWQAKLRAQIERSYDPKTDEPYGAFSPEDAQAFEEALSSL